MKIVGKCDNCPETGELVRGAGRPDGWVAIDIEGPGGASSLVLCPGCAEAKFASILPRKPKPLPGPAVVP